MSKQVTALLNDMSVEIVETYMEANKCCRNRAINDLIASNQPNELLKYVKAIWKKVKTLDNTEDM